MAAYNLRYRGKGLLNPIFDNPNKLIFIELCRKTAKTAKREQTGQKRARWLNVDRPATTFGNRN